MTFEQYCNYMTAYNFKVVYSPSIGNSRGEIGNAYVTTMTDKKLFRFDCASNEYTGIRLYGEVQYINFSTLCLILDLTNRFLTTPYEDRHLNATYNLLVESNANGSWFLGYRNGEWQIDNYDNLVANEYQTTFTDSDLIAIADGDTKELGKLNALKERV